MESGDHGGGCCGISHIATFQNYRDHERNWRSVREIVQSSTENIREDYEYQIREYGEKVSGAHLFEIVLTDEQLIANDNFYALKLKEDNWKLVSRFKNFNSGNYCNIFHKTSGMRCQKKKPFPW